MLNEKKILSIYYMHGKIKNIAKPRVKLNSGTFKFSSNFIIKLWN